MRVKHLLALILALGCRSRTASDRITKLAVDARRATARRVTISV